MSWDRVELKRTAKQNMKANYWACFFAALILALAFGVSAGGIGGRARGEMAKETAKETAVALEAGETAAGRTAEEVRSDPNASISELMKTLGIHLSPGQELSQEKAFAMGTAVGSVGLLITLLNIFLFGPLTIGAYGFFAENTTPPARLNEIMRAFKEDYLGNVLTIFLMRLFITLWTLLFVIPGIVKSYSYRMAPYIKMEHPEMSATACITRSRQMMKGNKWRTFVLDLSFLGWFLLEIITLGIVGVFWVQPYYQQTDAQLYRALSEQF